MVEYSRRSLYPKNTVGVDGGGLSEASRSTQRDRVTLEPSPNLSFLATRSRRVLFEDAERPPPSTPTVFDFALSDEDMRDLEVLQRCPKKLVRFDDLPDKFDLPDGYKLKGRIYGVPCGGFSLENNPALFANGFTTRQNVC
ncbi:hypothetical protein Y032_0639g995 [Ancylostoma ceylanicum]|uniref:Uncharacterized protein n=1 Tax=Ancylostoma ceylanicum TaxID=53326 RepID=A0A016WLC1_9BILA|nr:hypothetical protein Y032_0639g995 [Ancylostoma ceylanicum]